MPMCKFYRNVRVMQFRDFTNEQSRQFIDVSQVFEGWRADNALFKHKFKAVMRWVRRGDDRGFDD